MLPRAREEGRCLLGGLLDGLGLDREVHREGAPDVLGEGDDEERAVLGGEGDDGVVVAGEEGVDAPEEYRAHGEGGRLGGGGVQAEEGGEEDVEEDADGGDVDLGVCYGGGPGGRDAVVEDVRDEVFVPGVVDDALAYDRPQVREGRELRDVVGQHDEPGGVGVVDEDAREVGVDEDLGVLRVGEPGVELGDGVVEGGVIRDKIYLRRCLGDGVVVGAFVIGYAFHPLRDPLIRWVPLCEARQRPEPLRRKQPVDLQGCRFAEGLGKSS